MVSNFWGIQYKLENNAKCEIFGMLWRILVANSSAQRVFGEVTGFSLLLTTLHSFQNSDSIDHSIHRKVSSFLFRVITAGVFGNTVNRLKLHAVMSSQTFYELLCESGLLNVDSERQMIQLLLELALEIVFPPSSSVAADNAFPAASDETQITNFLSSESMTSICTVSERVYNASAVGVLLRSLLQFTPKLQLELLSFIEKLANSGTFNQENLTSIGTW